VAITFQLKMSLRQEGKSKKGLCRKKKIVPSDPTHANPDTTCLYFEKNDRKNYTTEKEENTRKKRKGKSHWDRNTYYPKHSFFIREGKERSREQKERKLGSQLG